MEVNYFDIENAKTFINGIDKLVEHKINESKQNRLIADDSISIEDNRISAIGCKFNKGTLSFWNGTQSEYDSITDKNPSTLYIITD